MMFTAIETDLPVSPTPAVAVTLSVKVPVAAPLEPPLEQPPTYSPTHISPSPAAIPFNRRPLRHPNGNSTPTKPKVEIPAHVPLPPMRLATAPPVLIANMIVAGCTPSGVAFAGLKLQLTFAGKVPQEA